MTPVLETPRLKLIPHEPELVTERQVRWLNTPDLMQFSEQRHKTHTLLTQKAYVAKHNRDNQYLWLIRDSHDRDIGTVTAYVSRLTADMGILLGEEHGKGYGAEAWQRVMRFLFRIGIKKITCGCMKDNGHMRMLAWRAGMREVPMDERDPFIFFEANNDPTECASAFAVFREAVTSASSG